MLSESSIGGYMNRALEGMASLDRTVKDSIIGDYNVLSLVTSDELFLQKKYLSTDFDVYSKIEAFLGLIIKRHEHVCDLYSVLTQDMNPGEFELIFRHDSPFNETLKDESDIWVMLYHLSLALSSLEQVGIPYPLLSRYYVLKGDEGYKLMNPFVFPKFLGEVLSIYLNPLIQVSQKKLHHANMIARSLSEFQILTITLISGNINEAEIAERSKVFFKEIDAISKKYSVYLTYFCTEIFKNAKSFSDFAGFFSANVSKLPEKFQIYYRQDRERLNGISPNLPREVQHLRQPSSDEKARVLKVPSLKELMENISHEAKLPPPQKKTTNNKVKTRVFLQMPSSPGEQPFKIVEYSDGTKENLPLTTQERQELQERRNDTKRVSFTTSPKKPIEVNFGKHYEFTVEQHSNPMLLYEFEAEENNRHFAELAAIVNVKEPSKPSEYHLSEAPKKIMVSTNKRIPTRAE